MRKKVNVFLLFIMLLNASNAYAQCKIEGLCVDETMHPLPNVNVSLLNPVDSTLIKNGISNMEGMFILDEISNGSYCLRFSMVGFQTTYWNVSVDSDLNIGKVVLNENIESLEEIVVTADVLKSYGNRDEIYFSKKNRNVGTNALEAIASVPQFSKNMMNDELETIDKKKLLILIDGIRASSRELAVLQSDDVKNLTYYTNPPARYAFENVGGVLDIQTRKKRNKLFTAYLNTKNSFTTGYGTNSLNLIYRDSLNSLSAYYLIDYRNLNDNRRNNEYQYPTSSNRYIGLPGKYKGAYHIGRLTYQRNQGNNLFNIRFSYRKDPGIEKYGQQAFISVNDSILNGFSNKDLKSDYDSWSLDLFYSKALSKSRSFSINMVNTYYLSDSKQLLSRTVDEYKQMNYHYKNEFNNKSYSLIVDAIYSDRLWNGNWNIGTYFMFKDLKQTFNGVRNPYISNKRGYVYTDYSNYIGKLSYTLGVGLEDISYSGINENDFNYWVFRPSLVLAYQPNRNLAFRFNSRIQPQVPSTGYLTNSMSSIDEFFYSRGNPDLKPYYTFTNGLDMQVSLMDGKFYMAPSFYYNYSRHPFAPVLQKEGEYIYLQQMELDNIRHWGASMSSSYAIAKFLTIQPFYAYTHYEYDTPNNSVSHDIHNLGVGLQMSLGKWQMSWYGNIPFKTVSGDTYNKLGFNTTASILWKHKSISIGADFIYNPYPSRISAQIDGFSYSEETVWGNFKNLVDVKFTYRLSKGKARKHKSKNRNNSDSDSGLIDFNTAK